MSKRASLTHRLPVLAASLMLASALAACGGEEEKTDEAPAEEPAVEAPAAETPAARTGPAPAEGYDWTLTELEDTPGRIALAYNVPETDDVPLSFVCQEGAGYVSAEVDSGITGVGALILRSGDSQGMYPITNRQPSEMSGGEFLIAEIDVADPTMQAFKSSGWINLTLAGAARDMAAHPGAAPAAISGFFDRCAASTEVEGA